MKTKNPKKYKSIVSLIVILAAIIILIAVVKIVQVVLGRQSIINRIYNAYKNYEEYEEYEKNRNKLPQLPLLPKSVIPIIENKISLATIFSKPTHSYPSVTSPPTNPQTQLPINAKKIISPMTHPSLATPEPTLKKMLSLGPIITTHPSLTTHSDTHPSLTTHSDTHPSLTTRPTTTHLSNDSFISGYKKNHKDYDKHYKFHEMHYKDKSHKSDKGHHLCSIS